MTSPARAELLLQTWGALKGATWPVIRQLQANTGDADVTPAQIGLLHVLLDEPKELMTPQQLARRLDVTPATITGTLNRLEEGGYVERLRESTDRRVVKVQVTAAGRALHQRWREGFRERLAEVMAPLTDAQLRTLVEILHRVGPPIEGPPGGYGALLRHGAPTARSHAKAAKRKAR